MARKSLNVYACFYASLPSGKATHGHLLRNYTNLFPAIDMLHRDHYAEVHTIVRYVPMGLGCTAFVACPTEKLCCHLTNLISCPPRQEVDIYSKYTDYMKTINLATMGSAVIATWSRVCSRSLSILGILSGCS